MSGISPRPTLRVRSVFISDAHLGFRGCRSGFLLEFPRSLQCGEPSLIGDFIDLCILERPICRPEQRSEVVSADLSRARLGARDFHVLGRRDSSFRDFGSWLRCPGWSISAVFKHRARNKARHTGKLEPLRASESRCRGGDGFVCGYDHGREIGGISGVLYSNDGDQNRNCTTLVENSTARLNLLRWTGMADIVAGDAPVASIGLGEAA